MCGRIKTKSLALTIGVACALAAAAPQALAQAPYEPNDSVGSATPLSLAGQYQAGIETDNDVDLYEFYIATDGTQITANVTNGAATDSAEGLEGAIVPATDFNSPLTSFNGPFGLTAGGSEPLAASLKPGKYYLQFKRGTLSDSTAFPYSFQFSDGAVDAATMQGLCDTRRDSLRRSERTERDAKRRLRRARRHGSRRTVRRARKSVKHADGRRKAAAQAVKTYCVVS